MIFVSFPSNHLWYMFDIIFEKLTKYCFSCPITIFDNTSHTEYDKNYDTKHCYDIIILFLPIKHYDNSFDVEFGTKYLTSFF